jgi:hypothetical protein
MAGAAVAAGITKTQNLVRDTALIFVHCQGWSCCPCDAQLTAVTHVDTPTSATNHVALVRQRRGELIRMHRQTPHFHLRTVATEENKTAGSNRGSVRLLGYDVLSDHW